MMDEYRLFSPAEVSNYKSWARTKFFHWKRNDIDAVLLTETSATPLGWLVKECWKTVERLSMPRFYRTNLGTERGEPINGHSLEVARSYVEKRRLDDSSKVLVFDELRESAKQAFPKKCSLVGNERERENYKLYQRTVRRNIALLINAGICDLWADDGCPDLYIDTSLKCGTYFGSLSIEGLEREGLRRYVKPTWKSNDSKTTQTAMIESNPEMRRRARDFIHDLKLAGRQAGMEIKKENPSLFQAA